MFVTLYDNEWNAIADNSSLAIESIQISKRPTALNAFKCTCEPIELNIIPMFAVIKTNTGERYYDCLRPLLTKDKNNRTTIEARDLKGIFNTEVYIDWSKFSGTTVKQYLQFLFNTWTLWDESGFDSIDFNLWQDADIPLYEYDNVVILPSENKPYNIFNLLMSCLSFYGLYMDSKINFHKKSLDFTIDKNTRHTFNIRLEDFGITEFELYEPIINTATTLAIRAGGTIRHDWFLLQDGAITFNPALRNIYPTSASINFIDGDEMDKRWQDIVDPTRRQQVQMEVNAEFINKVNEADFNNVSLLANNRYKENILLDSVRDERLANLNFTGNDEFMPDGVTRKRNVMEIGFNIYYQGKFYKTLPAGEIVDNGKQNKVIRIGQLENEFIRMV